MLDVKPEEDLLYLVKTISKELALDFDRRLEEHDLTSQQGRLLFNINYLVNIKKLTVHQNDIERMLNLSKSTVSGLVDRLEAKELIKRINAHPYVEIVPTEKAQGIISEIWHKRECVMKSLLRGFNDEEITLINSFLKRMLENIKEGENVKEN